MIENKKHLLPIFKSPDHLEIVDIQNAAYDVQLSATTLAGLANREQPRIYLLGNNDAESLFNALLAHVPHERVTAAGDETLDTLLTKYRDMVKGLVIYDPAMLDSVNVATTLVGLRDGIVVSPRQAEVLQQKPHQLSILTDLRSYHWKNRLQAYRWATRNLLKGASRQVVAGLNPRVAGGLRSFLVATHAFVYWLNPLDIWPDPASGWSSERCQMKRIMRSFPPGTPHMGWYVNEFAGVHIASKAAMPTLPSDYFYNLEVWTAVQAPSNIDGDMKGRGSTSDPNQNDIGATNPDRCDRGTYYQGGGQPRPYPTTNEKTDAVQGTGVAGPRPGNSINGQQIAPKVYVSFTISDGDNLQFDQHRMYQLWQDPARGSTPLGWTISPVLIEAAPTLAAYYGRTATQNDELVAGPSGAGYMWPSSWPADRLAAYLQLTGALMKEMRLRTIEVLDGPISRIFPDRAWQQRYAKFLSPYGLEGILSGDSYTRAGWRVVEGIPVVKNLGLLKNAAQTLTAIHNNTPARVQHSTFLNVYIYAWSMTPTDIQKVMRGLDSRYEVVTPGHLCALIAQTREWR